MVFEITILFKKKKKKFLLEIEKGGIDLIVMRKYFERNNYFFNLKNNHFLVAIRISISYIKIYLYFNTKTILLNFIHY